MKLLADSAVWLALYDRGDKFHARARHAFESLAEAKVTFIVTDYLVAEATTLIRGRVGHAPAVACGDWLLGSPRVRLVRIDLESWTEAWQLFKKYDDKEFSFVDCASFIVMRREHVVDALTFDRHFEQMGFRLWPRIK